MSDSEKLKEVVKEIEKGDWTVTGDTSEDKNGYAVPNESPKRVKRHITIQRVNKEPK